MYFDQGSKNLKIQNMMYLDFKNIFQRYILLVYGGIFMKMDNSHLFEMVKKKIFYAWVVIDNEIYKQHCCFLTCT
jgi:hypothetical protein